MDRWRASLWLFALALLACALALALEAGSEASRLSLREWATLGLDGGTTSGDETLLPPHPRPIDAGVGASVMSVALEIYDALSQRATSQAPSLPALDGLEVLGSSSLKDMCAVGAYRGHLLVVFRGTQSMDELLRNVFGDQFLASGSKVDILARLGLPLPFPQQASLRGDAPHVQVNKAFLATLLGCEAGVLRALERLPSGRPVWLYGHSLGAAVAALFAARRLLAQGAARLRLIMSACPKPGNRAFRELLLRIPCVHFVNDNDLIPWLPPAVTPDLTRASGTLEYVPPPATQTFSVIAATLADCHESPGYLKGIGSFLPHKAAGPPPV